ncbi:kinase [Thraustotheca clavata]|uniref:Kinase n=1 Tax=Thraustotheca clavata TaxID=74557 RepID=A0A1W0A323_9STRA|nr:kinase [Thraustotheca clavata]
MGNCVSKGTDSVLATESFEAKYVVGDATLLALSILFRELQALPQPFDSMLQLPFGAVQDGMYHEELVLVTQMYRGNTPRCNDAMEDFVRVLKLYANIQHPNIVRLIGASWDVPHFICMVTERPERGDLATLLFNYGEDIAPTLRVNMMLDIAKAMAHLHSRKHPLLHRDLKGSNIYINAKYRAKITHFESSGEYASHFSVLDLPAWTAPETICGHHVQIKVMSTASQWVNTISSTHIIIKIVMDELMNCQAPYAEIPEGRKQRELVNLIACDGYRPSIINPHVWPDDLLELVETCWRQDPRYRPTFASIKTSLEHVLQNMVDI